MSDPTSATGQAIDRELYFETEDLSDSEIAKGLTIDGAPILSRDADFDTELEYEGYRSIEAYDGDEYNSNVDDDGEDGKELHFKDRPRNRSITEEDPTDKQANR